MEARTSCYIYDGKLWTAEPTESDNDSFFHSVFGYTDNEKKKCVYEYAKDKRTDWSKFLTSFENEPMPSHLADVLRKCLSANDKYKNAFIEDKYQFAKYVADIAAAEYPVTIEEIPILAALFNLEIVILSKSQSDSVIIQPDLEIPHRHRRDFVNRHTEKKVLCVEGNIFSRAKIADENLTKQYQVDYLINYWSHNLKIDDTNKNKCERYATAVINKLSSWKKVCHFLRNHFTDVQLQLIMLAESFQENSLLDATPD